MSANQNTNPWGSHATRQALANRVNRNSDGNFASTKNGVGAPKPSGGFGKRIALTFDDGPNPKTTPQVLDVLRKHGLTATFFVHGGLVRGQAEVDILNRIHDEGHTVANHAEGHENFNRRPTLAGPSVSKTHGRISALLSDRVWWFRFPGGNASVEAIREVERQGYAVVGWHIDSADWCYASGKGGPGVCTVSEYEWMPEEFRSDMAKFVLNQARKTGGGILLMHDNRAFTAGALSGLLDELKADGFTFTSLDDADAFPILNGWAATLMPG